MLAGFLRLFCSFPGSLFRPLLLFLYLLGRGLAGRTDKLILTLGADNPNLSFIPGYPYHLVTAGTAEIYMGLPVPDAVAFCFDPSAETGGVIHDPAPAVQENLIFLAARGNIP